MIVQIKSLYQIEERPQFVLFKSILMVMVILIFTYIISSLKFKKYFKINAKTGKLTVKKGLQTGTYKVRVKIKAFGNGNYKASKTKTIVSKIIIR